jgi:hypothetical protein
MFLNSNKPNPKDANAPCEDVNNTLASKELARPENPTRSKYRKTTKQEKSELDPKMNYYA